MKKTVALLLSLALIIICFTACGAKEDYTLGIGIAEEVDYEKGTIIQAVAGIVTDTDGNVVLTRLDAVEYNVKVEGGNATVYVPTACRDDEDNSAFKADADYLEEYARGKTEAELDALDLNKLDKSGAYSNLLLRAIKKALSSEYKTAFKSESDLTLGVSLFAYASADDEKGTLTLGASFAAIAAYDGRIMGAVLDESDGITATIGEEDGKITSHSYRGTKLELGENYCMDDYNPSAAGEWYEQAAAYVKSLYYKPTDRLDEIPDGTIAGCTIGVENYRAAVIKAARRVR